MEKEKKEIWKLLELLNEYLSPFSWYIHYHNGNGFKRTPTKSAVEWDRILQDEYVLGKSFGFVKWLVENEKIDRDNVRLRKSLWETDTSDIDEIIYTIKNSDYHYVMREAPYEAEETLLMLLSISDTPIEFLVSILK